MNEEDRLYEQLVRARIDALDPSELDEIIWDYMCARVCLLSDSEVRAELADMGYFEQYEEADNV